VKLLLDTHALLWLADGDPQLSVKATALIRDPANDLFFSMASVWELAIKVGLGKLALAMVYREYVTRAVSGYHITILELALDDCVDYEALTFPDPSHRDPFDRMIVVQSRRHLMNVLSIDDKLDCYGITRLW
jgi:PIN domain nuclease of toxin-antitoxin system